MSQPGMVIVGAGECGTRAALALREAGHDGPVSLIGAEPHLPYERPPLSKDALRADGPALKPIAGTDRFAEAGIDFRPACVVRGIDRPARRLILDGETLPYHRLLLATGARPRLLPGAAGPNVATLRSFDDAVRMRAALGPGRRLAIIGGGFIGLELAASARHLGAEVTVIETATRLLSRGVPAEIAGRLEARHRAEGVAFHLDATLGGIDPSGVRLADGTLLPADLVLVGIGAVPNVELAADAGLALDNGVAVDATLATSDPAIFAAGDCCAAPLSLYGGHRIRLESWRSAQEQGTLAARNMLGAAEPVSAVPWFWSDQYDLTLQVAGLATGAARMIRREIGNDALILFHLAEDGRLLAASGLGPGNAVAKDIRLAEMLIARRATPAPHALADPAASLRKLL